MINTSAETRARFTNELEQILDLMKWTHKDLADKIDMPEHFVDMICCDEDFMSVLTYLAVRSVIEDWIGQDIYDAIEHNKADAVGAGLYLLIYLDACIDSFGSYSPEDYKKIIYRIIDIRKEMAKDNNSTGVLDATLEIDNLLSEEGLKLISEVLIKKGIFATVIRSTSDECELIADNIQKFMDEEANKESDI